MIEIIEKYHQQFLLGVGYTILLAVVGTIGGFMVSLLLVSVKVSKAEKKDLKIKKVFIAIAKGLVNGYITFFRGTPMMIQALIFYYGVALITEISWWSPLIAGLIIVVLNTAAYIAEILRGAVHAIDPGQMEAARSLGFTRHKALYMIVFPQAIKNALPSIGNEFIVNLKDTSVLSVIGIFDLFNATRGVVSASYNYVAPYVIAAVIYLIMTSLTSLLVKKLEASRKEGVSHA